MLAQHQTKYINPTVLISTAAGVMINKIYYVTRTNTQYCKAHRTLLTDSTLRSTTVLKSHLIGHLDVDIHLHGALLLAVLSESSRKLSKRGW